MSKHLAQLKRVWIGANAKNMLNAVSSKDLPTYLRFRQDVVAQIKLFDEEMRVSPLVLPTCDVKCAERKKFMTYYKGLVKSAVDSEKY